MPSVVPPKFVIGRFVAPGEPPFTGVVAGDMVTRLSDTPVGSDALFDEWEASIVELSDWLARSDTRGEGLPLNSVHKLAPVSPRQLFQCGANYREHVLELLVARRADVGTQGDIDALRAQTERFLDERADTGRPYVFVGLPSSICGPEDDVVLPNRGTDHDWELELGVVIGRRARNVSRDSALDYVAGYTIVNDITTRDLVTRQDFPGIGADWLASKGAATFTPVGPYLVPAAYVDPAKLRITLRLNGELMQDSMTDDMIFSIPRLIEYLSSIIELRPGDLLTTGSPAGNGAHYGRYLRPGDVMEGAITGLGRQRNRCVAE
jgi:2-keto-4-pentenoate hydratase/2-oxohepta-3-ene-1,7-dioic acid hydratase in catechol pathway